MELFEMRGIFDGIPLASSVLIDQLEQGTSEINMLSQFNWASIQLEIKLGT
jgi:hypothetical protein